MSDIDAEFWEAIADQLRESIKVEVDWRAFEPVYQAFLDRVRDTTKVDPGIFYLTWTKGELSVSVHILLDMDSDDAIDSEDWAFSDILLRQYPDCRASTDALLDAAERSIAIARAKHNAPTEGKAEQSENTDG